MIPGPGPECSNRHTSILRLVARLKLNTLCSCSWMIEKVIEVVKYVDKVQGVEIRYVRFVEVSVILMHDFALTSASSFT